VRLALVVNPAAGSGRNRVSIPGAEIVDIRELDRLETADRIVVAGGDGSIGPVAELAGRLNTPLAVIPSGTANDFARANGIPLDLQAATRLAMSGTELRSLELGHLATGRPFVNVASAGLSSLAGRRAQPLKSRFGPLAYGLGAARAAATGRPLHITVDVDGQRVYAADAWQVMVACTGAFGGGSGIGAADATDGDLDVVIVPAGSRAGLVKRAWGLRTQTIERQRNVAHFEGRVVSVIGAGEINCDGEFVAGGLERVTARANAFRLVVPAGEQ
jgi:diacylglycerol kinase family enzyme